MNCSNCTKVKLQYSHAECMKECFNFPNPDVCDDYAECRNPNVKQLQWVIHNQDQSQYLDYGGFILASIYPYIEYNDTPPHMVQMSTRYRVSLCDLLDDAMLTMDNLPHYSNIEHAKEYVMTELKKFTVAVLVMAEEEQT